MHENETVLYQLDRIEGQHVLEYRPTAQQLSQQQSAFVTARRRRTTRDPRPDSVANGQLWHRRMGHIGQWPLHYLGKNVLGARLRGPCTTDCTDCAVAKITRQISRRPLERPVVQKPCYEVHIDLTDLQEDYQGYLRVMFITCRWTGMIFPYFIAMHGAQHENLRVLRDFVR